MSITIAVPTREEPASADNVLAPVLSGIEMRPATPEAALAALEDVVARLSSVGDARAAFPNVYAVITQLVIERLNDRSGYFQAPEFISMLVGVFTTRYLQTLDWSLRDVPQDCRGWDLAYRLAARDEFPATAHAVLGISAHINYDLALGIHEVVVRLGASGDQARLALFKHDHDAVNALLAASFPESMRRLREVHGCAFLRSLPDAAIEQLTPHMLEMLSGWRDDVWRNMLDLLGAASAAERAALIARMDERSGETGAKIARQSTIMWLVGLFSNGVRFWSTATAPLFRGLRVPVPAIPGLQRRVTYATT
jgi:hypothetical protein